MEVAYMYPQEAQRIGLGGNRLIVRGQTTPPPNNRLKTKTLKQAKAIT
jgi:hypothetical protein